MRPSELFPGTLNIDRNLAMDDSGCRTKAIASTSSRTLHLPNGQQLLVLPVFGGFLFKPDDLNPPNTVIPASWTVILQTEDSSFEDELCSNKDEQNQTDIPEKKTRQIHPYRKPTLQHDNLFISSISNPSSNDYPTPISPSRQIAMMLWVSLYWYFHQQEPPRYLTNKHTENTPDAGKPQGEWRINIKREGVLRGRHLIQKLERMALVMSEDSSVGLTLSDGVAECWSNTFTSQRAFWQIPAKYFLHMTLNYTNSLFPASPYASRPNSPVFGEHKTTSPKNREAMEYSSKYTSPGLMSPLVVGPLISESQYATCFPPAPLQYIMSSGVLHPLRPKPPGQGEIFYTRYIPSVGQYLSFRTASLSDKPVTYYGPFGSSKVVSHQSNHSMSSISPQPCLSPPGPGYISHYTSHSMMPISSNVPLLSIDEATPSSQSELINQKLSDCQLLHKWMNIPRVSKFWGCDGDVSRQEEFMRKNLEAKHSFPVIGLWDGKPFGYFEIYWAKEDIINKYIDDGNMGDWDRGIHVLIGDDEFRGPHRVKCWLTALAHWVFTEDYRTNCLVLEPRVDNKKYIKFL